MLKEEKMKEYSAGIVSTSFWYSEFRQYLQLIKLGMSEDTIREKAIAQNIFLASTPARSKRMIGALTNRVGSLDEDEKELFDELDIPNQKALNMIAIMNTNKLIREFMYEIYRNELILGDSVIEPHEYVAFFNKKQSESAEVAAWTDQTVHRMKGIIHTFLIDAGLVVEENGKDYIKRLQLNRRLRQLFINKGQQILVDSLTGEN
ncbi:MAG: hypothetical protein Q611_LSC00185G0002 [Leuconostoc sp. DORA_2]|jgi:hypothetical protein|nr:MAG: hypothetical protein Q611_LSC00185G0002 [Leuconostoc sp. DORA_2]